MTKANKRRTVHEEIEEVQTIRFFDNPFQSGSFESTDENIVSQIPDPCIVPVETITLPEVADNGNYFVNSFDETVSLICS